MTYNASREARRRRRRRRKILQAILPVVIAIVLMGIIGLVAYSTGVFDDFGYSSRMADLKEYFATSPEEINTTPVYYRRRCLYRRARR